MTKQQRISGAALGGLAMVLSIGLYFSGCSEGNARFSQYSCVREGKASMAQKSRLYAPPVDREAYDPTQETGFVSVGTAPLSTFGVDVDTASYANLRRLIRQGSTPPPGAIQIEEMVNYFQYNYASPSADSKDPLAIHAAVAATPWNEKTQLVRIALKAKEIQPDKRPHCNLVFLLDVSGSMSSDNKLGLVKRSMKLLTQQLGEKDTVSIVVYAGAAGVVLAPTEATDSKKILRALDKLQAGGSTAGGAGIQLAYKLAKENFITGGVNRVILCTDGDFNVGTTDRSSLSEFITEKAKTGVFLTVLGFGTGNYQSATMQDLANKGNGTHGYIDTFSEAKKHFVHDLTGTLVTVAKDVKIQVEFNPAAVRAYRLIGYENRRMAAEDFKDDKKDSGEVGAGHAVTALYEIIPAGSKDAANERPVDELEFSTVSTKADAKPGTLLAIKVRYKQPDGANSHEMKRHLKGTASSIDSADGDFRWAVAVAGFAQVLRDSKYKGTFTIAAAEKLARTVRLDSDTDPHGYKAEFLKLVKESKSLKE